MILEEQAKYRDRDHSGVLAGSLSEMPLALGCGNFSQWNLNLGGLENAQA